MMKICPRFEWIKIPHRFIFLSETGRWEVWEIVCSLTEYSLKSISRSDSGVIWCGIWNNKDIEYVKHIPKTNEFIFVSITEDNNKTSFNLPTLSSKDDPSFCHISSCFEQDVLLYNIDKVIGIILPRSAVQLQLLLLEPNQNSLNNLAVLINDLLIIVLPNQGIFCILLDVLTQPRAAFGIKVKHCNDFSFISPQFLHAIDKNSGRIEYLDFDYESILQDNPYLFIPLLHFSVMQQGIDSCIFTYLSLRILENFWCGPIFDEFLLCLIRTDLLSLLDERQKKLFTKKISTFCSPVHFSSTLPLFTPFQSRFMDKTVMPPPVQNWKRIISLFKDPVSSIRDKLILILSSFKTPNTDQNIQFHIRLQILILIFRLTNSYQTSDTLQEAIIPTLMPIVSSQWASQSIIPYESTLNINENEKLCWWKMRANPDLIQEIQRKPIQDTLFDHILIFQHNTEFNCF